MTEQEKQELLNDKDEPKVTLLVVMYLTNEIAKLHNGWGRRVRARKKFLRKQLREGLQALRVLGVLGRHSKAKYWPGVIFKSSKGKS